MTPDYQSAATKALEILRDRKIGTAPVIVSPIIKSMEGVLVLSYEEMSKITKFDRKEIIKACGSNSTDAVTTVHIDNGKLRYIVAYNQGLPVYIIQRALARELGHIVLGHDGSKPESVRIEEAKCFAHHLLCPRPLIYSLLKTNLRFTVEMLGNVTGCYDNCLTCMRKMPAVSTPADLNRAVRDQFMPYIINFYEFQRGVMLNDVSAGADFGTYMDGYEE